MIHKELPSQLTIAIDAMGGDRAPGAIISGADIVAKTEPDIAFIFFGRESEIAPVLSKYPRLREQGRISPTEDVVKDDDKPSLAIRQGRNSSMGRTIKSVRDHKAHAAVSGGNTGALMAMSKLILRTLPGIDRPAIGGCVPSIKHDNVMLDLGGNVTCDANNLFEFAVMGDAFARVLLSKENPAIGLLNIGTEDVKGNEAIKAAASMLRESELDLNFYGYVEGDDIGKGTVDVIVTDGFTGNVALKTLEGTASMCGHYIKRALRRSILAKIGSLFLAPALCQLKKEIDPRHYNGAMFLGLNGIIIKSHGGSDDVASANAIRLAITMARHQINEKIIEEMIQSGHILPDENDYDETEDFE